jgi:hypothetical protein
MAPLCLNFTECTPLGQEPTDILDIHPSPCCMPTVPRGSNTNRSMIMIGDKLAATATAN